MAINIRQTAAVAERIRSNTRHRVADGDGGQTAAIRVFANCFVSTTYTLKGRKVTTRILNNGENGEI